MAERFDTIADANVSWGAKFGGGIVAGLLAAVLMMGFMMAYSSVIGADPTMPLKALGALVYGVEALVIGTVAMAAGAGIQLGFSIMLGILFGIAMSRRTSVILAMLWESWSASRLGGRWICTCCRSWIRRWRRGSR